MPETPADVASALTATNDGATALPPGCGHSRAAGAAHDGRSRRSLTDATRECSGGVTAAWQSSGAAVAPVRTPSRTGTRVCEVFAKTDLHPQEKITTAVHTWKRRIGALGTVLGLGMNGS